MKILFIANDFPSSIHPTKGIFNLQLVRALAREHRVRVVSPIPWLEELSASRAGAKIGDVRRTDRDGVTVYYPRYWYPPKLLRTTYGWFYWHSIARLVRRLIAEDRPDAVLAYWAHPDGEAAIRAGRIAGAVSAVIVGGSDVLLITRGARRRRRVVSVLRNIGAVISVNKDLASKVTSLGVNPENVRQWEQGIDETIFYQGDTKAARTAIGIDLDTKVLLWVGRMVPVKGLEILIDAAARLRDRGAAFHLYLIGDGPLRHSVETDIARRELTGHVTLVGDRQPRQLGNWYRAADLFVMSSWSEGLPNVLRESVACGTPFVASSVGGISEIASENDELFPAGDDGAMCAAMERMIGKPKAVGSKVPWTWAQSAEKMVEILQSIPRPLEAVMADKRHEAPSPFRPRQIARALASSVLPADKFLTRGPLASKAICLTFDDGPHPSHTPQVLDCLAEHDVRATFFIVGRHAQRYPHLVERIVAEGHSLGSHTFYHADPRSVSPSELIQEIRQTQSALDGVIDRKLKLFRPPFGKLNIAKLIALWRADQTIVLWNRDPKDYAARDEEYRLHQARKLPLMAGDIVLLHDSLAWASDTARTIIERAKSQGLGFATIDQWTARPADQYDPNKHAMPEVLS